MKEDIKYCYLEFISHDCSGEIVLYKNKKCIKYTTKDGDQDIHQLDKVYGNSGDGIIIEYGAFKLFEEITKEKLHIYFPEETYN